MADSSSGLAGGLLFLVVGAAIVGGGLYLYQDAKQATASATEVEGTVVSSTIGEKTVQDESGGRSHRTYYAEIRYRYTYEGATYRSTNLCPGRGSACEAAQNDPDRGEIEEIVARYPEGETTTVHVPPEDPSNAYLVDASSASTNDYLILVGFGGLVGVAGLAVFVGAIKDLLTG
jgi:hypothetical protein